MSQEPLPRPSEWGSGVGLFGRELYQFALGVLGASRQAREAIQAASRRMVELRRAPSAAEPPLRVALHRAVWLEARRVIERTWKEREERRQAEEQERRKKLRVNREHYLEISDPLMPDSLVDHAENAISVLSDEERPVSVLKIFLGFGMEEIAQILERPREDVEKCWRECVAKLRVDLRRTHETLDDPERFLKRLRLKSPDEPAETADRDRPPTQRIQTDPAPAAPPSTRRQVAPVSASVPRWLAPVWRPVLIVAATLLLFAVATGGFYSLMLRTAREEFGSLLQGLRASQEPIRLADVRLPDAPDEENAFPLYARTAEAFRSLRAEEEEILENALCAMREPGDLDSALLRTAAQIVEARAADLAPLSEAAKRPRYAWCAPPNRRMIAEMPHLNGLHHAALALAVRASVRSRLRSVPPPADDLAALARLCAALRDEPTLGGQLFRGTAVRRTLQALEVCFNEFYFSRSRLEPIEKWIDPDASVLGIAKALQVERAAGLDAFHALLEGGDGVDSRLSREASNLAVFVYRDASQYVRAMNSILGSLHRGDFFLEGGPALEDQPPVSRALLTPLLRGGCPSFLRARAHESMIRTAIRLRLYKLLQGSYPERLEGLHAGPQPDPCAAGGELRYRREGQGFLLYSVGLDGRDDGGQRGGDADLVLFVVK